MLDDGKIDRLTPSAAELAFLWWFIQGSIMDADVRNGMLRAWGLCERHTLTWLRVEAAWRHAYLHGPAVFYLDLMEHAERTFVRWGRVSVRWLARRLCTEGVCHLCAMTSAPPSTADRLDPRLLCGQDAGPLRAFMRETEPDWRPFVCGVCAGSSGLARCRRHLCDDLARAGAATLPRQREAVETMAARLARYDASFQWELRGSDRREDRAALICAAGWSAGWRDLLAFYDVEIRQGVPS
ncbi:hypothetical protein [Crenobacter luteus]|uniref:Uncharacterized protein n=1 Tax=Crenobacter luteus TaxID=1452487 RepID=A0A165FKF0_9NEIS|nr:hypothetical protein [Crenobacter luteus]KZE33552.1 hypothetical protein AVW16_08430 [Crenobacter luteus]